MTKDIQQANVCGIAFCPQERSYFLVGTQKNPIQIDPVLGSLWYVVSMDDYWTVPDGNLQIYRHAYNAWLPIGTVIEFRNHLPISIEGE